MDGSFYINVNKYILYYKYKNWTFVVFAYLDAFSYIYNYVVWIINDCRNFVTTSDFVADETNIESLSDAAFRVGEVYNRSAATQVHVLPATTGGLPVTAAT